VSRLRKLGEGLGWGGLSMVVMTGLQLVFMALMARMLEPADFGLVAIANIGLRFLSYFSQLGVGAAIIQKPKIESGDIPAAFFLSVVISIFFFLAALALAPLMEQFFKIAGLRDVTRVLAISFITAGLSAVSSGLIRRDMRFKRLAVIDTVAYFIGYGLIGLTAAYAGWGVWALVAASTAQGFVSLTLTYAAARHPLCLAHTKTQRHHFLAFGSKYSLIGFVEFLSANLDSLLIGKMMGAPVAGIYNRAMLLANLPVQQPVNVLTRALFPMLSSMVGEGVKQSKSVQLSMLVVGVYACAVSGGIAAGAVDVVAVLLGDKWVDVVPILQILCFSVAPIYISHTQSVTLDALGELRIKLKVQCAMVVTLLLLLAALYRFGPAGVAAALVLNEILRLIVLSRVLKTLLQIATKQYLVIFISLATAEIISSGVIYLVARLLPQDFSPLIRLSCEIAAGVVGICVSLLITWRLTAWLPAVRLVVDRLPLFISRLGRQS
jgi:lipopolysaccharide exporter